jgi:hypothetical protein
VAACGKSKAQPDPAKPAAAAVALPAETKAVIGVDVARVAGSPLAVRAVRRLLDEDPETRTKTDSLLARCKIDPAVDLKTIVVAMAGPEDVAVVVTGRLDEKTLVACFRETAAVEQRGRVYVSTPKDGPKVFFAFGGEPSLVLSTTETWLAKIMDPGAAKIGGAIAARLAKVGPKAALWGVGELPPTVGQKLVELSQGQISAPATAITFEVELDTGIAASLVAEMATAADADKLAILAKSQLGWAAVFAQRWGLGRLVAKAQVHTEQHGQGVRVSLKLDDKELAELAAVLDGKEQRK